MKAKIVWILAICFVLGLLPLAMNAQEKPEKQYQLIWVMDACVKPSMNAEYYEAGKKIVEYFVKHEYPFPINTLWTSDNHVMWTVPIDSFADIDKMYAWSMAMEQKAPDEMAAINETFKGTTHSSRVCVYALDYKNSMMAKETEGESEEENFVFFDIYYFEPNRDAELNKIFDESREFMKDKEIIQSWVMYWGVMGTDGPVMWTAATAKNVREFYEENAKAWKVFGKEGGKIKQKMMKFVRKQEQKRAWFQKELSYIPSKKEE